MFEKVKEIMMDAVSCNEADITLEASLKDDLAIDSLDAVELSMALEEAFSLTIDQDDLAGFITVQDIVTYLENHQA